MNLLRRKVSTRVVIGVFLLLPCLSLAALAQTSGTGVIRGSVSDESGAVIPGTSVFLLTAGTVGEGQEVLTNENGVYQFVQLVPGSYGVRAELPGFSTAVRDGVSVNADVTVRVDLTLRVGVLTEVVTVTAEAPLVDTTSVLQQTVMDRAVLDVLPSRNDLWNIAKVVPAIVLNKVDVGGADAFSQSRGNVHGASQGAEGAFTIDGLEFGSALNAGASLAMYIHPAVFEQVNYQTGRSGAESQRGGLVYNLVTKTGTNQFHGSLQFTGSNESLQSNNITPALRQDLISGIPAEILDANPNLEPTAKVYGMFDTVASVTGPIIRDRLWFSGSAALSSLNKAELGSYNPDGTQTVDDNRKYDFTGKLSLQLNPDQQLHYYHQENRKQSYNFGCFGRFCTYNATRRQAPNGKAFDSLRWTAAHSPVVVTEVAVGVFHGFNVRQPQPGVGGLLSGAIPRYDEDTERATEAHPSYNNEPNRRYTANANISYYAGNHDFKFGYQYMGTFYQDNEFGISHFPSGLLAVYRSGVPDHVEVWNTPVQSVEKERNHSFFVTDKWQLTPGITLSLGVRVQKTKGWIEPTVQPVTPFVPVEQSFGKIEPPDFLTLNPRVAVIWDIFGDGRTALKLSVNRYDLGLGRPYTNRVNPVRLTSDELDWADLNGDLDPQLNEIDFASGSGFSAGTANRYDPDIKRPWSLEISSELEHEFPGGIRVAIAYFHRENRGNIGVKNLLVPREGYSPIDATISGVNFTLWNQDPATIGLRDNFWSNYDELDAQFNGFDLTVTKRFSSRWSMLGSLSHGNSHGDINLGNNMSSRSDLNNPNFRFRRGPMDLDSPWQFKMSGLYEFPYGVNVSGSFQAVTGLPDRQTVRASRSTFGLNQSSVTVEAAPQGEIRFPNVYMLDFSVRKDLEISESLTVQHVLDILNVGNINTVTDWSNRLGSNFHRVDEIVIGRMIKFGLNVNF